MKYTLLLPLLLVGCVGPMTFRTATLPDGHKIRAYRAGALVAPSVTVVAVREPGATNWTLPHVFSGPGFFPGIATGGSIIAAVALLHDHDSNRQSVTVNVDNNDIGGEGGGKVSTHEKKPVFSPKYKAAKKW